MHFPEDERRFYMKDAVHYCGLRYHTLRRELLKRGGYINAGLGNFNKTYLVPQSTLDQIIRERSVPRRSV